MSDTHKVLHWTQETRDALVLAEAAARLTTDHALRRLSLDFEKGALKITVEARR